MKLCKHCYYDSHLQITKLSRPFLYWKCQAVIPRYARMDIFYFMLYYGTKKNSKRNLKYIKKNSLLKQFLWQIYLRYAFLILVLILVLRECFFQPLKKYSCQTDLYNNYIYNGCADILGYDLKSESRWRSYHFHGPNQT